MSTYENPMKRNLCRQISAAII